MDIPMYYPPADKKTQNFVNRYPGRAISPNILVLHTMEVNGWPGYNNGGTAPHLSLRVFQNSDGSLKSFEWRQHYPFTRTARALKNLAGGVETNNSTQGVIQVELAGTCGWATKVTPNWADAETVYKIGKPLIDFLVFCKKELGIKLVAPYPFVAHNAPKKRMTYTQWLTFKGICGHQHVPENSHVDPGTIPIEWLIAEAEKQLNPPVVVIPNVPPTNGEVPVVTPPIVKPPVVTPPIVKPLYVPTVTDVDGRFNKETISLLQYYTGLRGKDIDGVWGPVSKYALQKWLIVRRDGIIGKKTVKALQARIGVPVAERDGIWYTNTTRYLQRYLNKRVLI